MTKSVVSIPFFDKAYDEITRKKCYDFYPVHYNKLNNMTEWNFPDSLKDKIVNETDDDWKDVDYSSDPTKMVEDTPDPKVTSDAMANIKMEMVNPDKYIPYTFKLRDTDTYSGCYEVHPYITCPCYSVKNVNCFSSCCKFKYSKNMFVNESKLKDGLEIMDIPSTLLETIDKREADNERKKRKAQERRRQELQNSRATTSTTETPNQLENTQQVIQNGINQDYQGLQNMNNVVQANIPFMPYNTIPYNAPFNQQFNPQFNMADLPTEINPGDPVPIIFQDDPNQGFVGNFRINFDMMNMMQNIQPVNNMQQQIMNDHAVVQVETQDIPHDVEVDITTTEHDHREQYVQTPDIGNYINRNISRDLEQINNIGEDTPTRKCN